MTMNEIAEAMAAVAMAAAWLKKIGNETAADYYVEAGFLMEGAHRLLIVNDPKGAAELMNDAGAALLLAKLVLERSAQAVTA